MTAAFHPTCDRGRAASCACRETRHPQWTLAATISASSLAFIDGSVVNVALPTLGRSLHGGSVDLQWTVNGYLLPLSALLLLGGAAGDNFGRRRLLMAGIVVFALASIGCALATGFGLLVTMRAFQGVGAAMLMPNSLGLLGAAFSGEARGRAIGTWAAIGVAASAIGPPLGGWLISVAGWQSIFLLNVPVAIVALLITRRYVAETSEGEQALDWPGAALATLALGALTWSLTEWSSRHVATAGTWFELVVGVAALAAFVGVERRKRDQAMMPIGMFASTPFVGLTLVTFLIYGALGGLFILLPYVLIEQGGYSPLQAGLALLPFPAIVGGASRFAGQLAGRFGPRWLLSIGSGVAALGYALLARVEPSGSYWTTVVPGAAVLALGMAGAVAPLTTAVLGAVDERHTGTASGFNSAVARTGGLIATALAGAVMARTGAALVTAFREAAWIGAALATGAGIAAFVSLAAYGRQVGTMTGASRLAPILPKKVS